jgi:hypothetical protein
MSTGAIPAFYVVMIGHGTPPVFATLDEVIADRNLMRAVQAQLARQAKELDEAAHQKRLIATTLADMAGGHCASSS